MMCPRPASPHMSFSSIGNIFFSPLASPHVNYQLNPSARMDTARDVSPLSKAANITGIMTFVVAVLGAAWLWINAIHKS